MSLIGAFHQVEKDGKPFLVYHHPKYHPILQTQSPSSSLSGETIKDEPTLFLCPNARRDRILVSMLEKSEEPIPLVVSPEYASSIIFFHSGSHPVLPLFWCNNKEFDGDGGCNICKGSNFGTDYYFCDTCDKIYHKECVESPLQIKNPYHPEHSLKLYFHPRLARIIECLWCGRRAKHLVYHCTICQAFMHPTCAMKPIPFVIDQPKRHDHPLTFFPRQTSLTCNVCGLLRKNYPTYICVGCNFVAHNDCMYSPHIIMISRHHHRISYISSIRSRECCEVCHQSINGDYGAYTCVKCSYAVHSRCALGKNVWDGKELEGVPEENDITQDVKPFHMISKGEILYFLHDHHLQLKVNIIYDENKICQACVLPIYEGNFYSCMECEFILHETCAKAPRIIRHALHPHQLILKANNGYNNGFFSCNACVRVGSGFVYQCPIKECEYYLDVRCALIPEPFDYQGHEHLLYLTFDQEEKPTCHMCKRKREKQLYCIKCDFIICIRCATLPYKTRYKYDKHFLTIIYGEEVGENWCEVCEKNLKDTRKVMFYWCNECCTTFHIKCLLSGDPYIKPGRYLMDGWEVQVLGKSHLSRPFCQFCKNRCQDKIFKIRYGISCSMKCCYKFIKACQDTYNELRKRYYYELMERYYYYGL